MSRNILLYLRYDGTSYHGWQLQNNAVTVQQKVNEAVNGVFNENINVNGCSRTDAGVHANMFCCNFKTDKLIPQNRIPNAVNSYLPPDISVFKATDVSENFHARFSCKSKEYVYRIYNSDIRNPFYENRALLYRDFLDTGMLNEQACQIAGFHDFASFCSSGGSVSDTHRTVYSANVYRNGDIVEFKIHGDGFLYNMVRIAVGTLLDISKGKLPKNSIPDILESCNRDCAGVTAPPHGLYLEHVYY